MIVTWNLRGQFSLEWIKFFLIGYLYWSTKTKLGKLHIIFMLFKKQIGSLLIGFGPTRIVGCGGFQAKK